MLNHTFLKYSAVIMVVLFTAAAPVLSAVVPANDIRDAVERYIGGISGTSNIEYIAVVPRLFDVSVEGSGAAVIEVSHNAEHNIGQILPVTVTIKDTDGVVLRQLRVSPRLRKFGVAAVLNKNIARGESIGKIDVDLIKTDITAARNYYSSCAEVSGMEAKKYLKAGAVISESDIRAPFAVKRGDKVTVEIRKEGLLLRTDGTARGNGSKGEVIKIYVDMTKTTISCKIVDSMTVVAGVEGG